MSKININKASKKELQQLPGIGTNLADKILALRGNKKNHFNSVEDIKQLKGVTKPIFEKIQNLITVSEDNLEPKTSKKRQSIVLHACGEPGRIKLELPLIEESGSKRVTISFSKTPGLLSSKKIALDDVVMKRSVFQRNGRSLKIKVPLAKETPPGTYETLITAGEVEYKALIDVTKKVATKIIPRKVFIEENNVNGIEQTFFISNNGNVPLTLRNPGAVILEPDFMECRTIRAAVKKLQNVKDMVEALSSVAGELDKLYKESGAMRITLKGKPIIIQPGTTKKVSFLVKLPNSLKKSVTYQGSFRFYKSVVTIIVNLD